MPEIYDNHNIVISEVMCDYDYDTEELGVCAGMATMAVMAIFGQTKENRLLPIKPNMTYLQLLHKH